MLRRKIQKKQGFTLVEITIGVGIIILLFGLSIYSLLRAKVEANDGAAVGSVKSIITAQENYRISNRTFANSLKKFVNITPPYLSNAFTDGSHQGYNFFIVYADANMYAVWAQPQYFGVTGSKFILGTQGGVFRFGSREEIITGVADLRLPGVEIPPIPQGYGGYSE